MKKSIYKRKGIYKIECLPINKVYVGQTKNNFGDRWDSTKSSLRHEYHWQKELQNDWNKYGEDAFKFSIVKDIDNIDDIDNWEVKYIALYQSIGKCYNIAIGGQSIGYKKGVHLSENAKKLIGEKNKVNMIGKRASDNTKQKMSESHLSLNKRLTQEQVEEIKQRQSSKKMSEETKQKLRDKNKGIKNEKKYSDETIREIRRLYEEDGLSVAQISLIYSYMPKEYIYSIVSYRKRKNA